MDYKPGKPIFEICPNCGREAYFYFTTNSITYERKLLCSICGEEKEKS